MGMEDSVEGTFDFDVEEGAAQIATELGFGGGSETPQESQEGDPLEKTPPASATTSSDENQLPQEPPATAPKTWRREAALQWESLPKWAQDEVLKRENDMFSGLEQYKSNAQRAQEFDALLQPYQPMFERFRTTPMEGIKGLLQVQAVLSDGSPEAKQQLLQRIIQAYNIPMEGTGQESDYVDPQVLSLQSELNALKSQLSGFTAAQARQMQESVMQQVTEFAAKPENRYFAELEGDIAALLSAGVVKTLPEAYEKALWANPSVRQKELDRLEAERKERLSKEEAERVQKARKASSTHVKTQARANTSAPAKTLDETLSDTFDSIQNRS